MADVVGVRDRRVLVALSTGESFSPSSFWGGWIPAADGVGGRRAAADVDGDRRADLVTFGRYGVHVSRSTGSRFEDARLWTAEFGFTTGWSWRRHEFEVVNIDGDGRADIVAFVGATVCASRSRRVPDSPRPSSPRADSGSLEGGSPGFIADSWGI